MVASMTETDIDQFIREQKNKLQNERHNLEEDEMTVPQQKSSRNIHSQQDLNIERLERQLNELRTLSVSAGEKLTTRRETTLHTDPVKPQPNKTTEPVDFFSKFGEYEKKKQKLRAELENDYQHHLAGENLRRYGNPKGPVGNTTSHASFKDNISLDIFGVEKPISRNRLKAIENTESSEPSKHIKWLESSQETSRDELNPNRPYQPTLNEEIESRLRRTQSPLLPLSNTLLDDPLWARLREGPPQLDSEISPLAPSNPLPTLPAGNISEIFTNNGTKQRTSPINPTASNKRRYPPRKTEETYATLPLGTGRNSAKQRQKESYREELRRQIDEKNAARLEERELSRKVYEPLLPFDQPKKETLPAKKDFLQDYSSPRRYAVTDNQLLSRNTNSLQPNNLLQPLPTSLLYEPSNRLQDGNSSSIDDAYRFYGIKDHFDTSVTPGFEPTFFTNQMEENEAIPQPKQNFPNVFNSKENVSVRPSALVFGESDNIKNSTKKKEQVYLKALEMQIQEKKAQKLKEKQAQENYEKNLEEERRNYNPFGRGGGGAPLKDSSGNVLANLRQFKKDFMNEEPSTRINQLFQSNPNPQFNQTTATTTNTLQDIPNYGLSNEEVTVNPQSNFNNPALETSHARGGHGIFGEPKTEAQKSAMDQYRDELQKQIVEKRNRKLAELALEKQEEDKFNKRLEDDRKKMQDEFEMEAKKKKLKAEEERKREEERKLQLLNKKAEAEKQLKDTREKEERERLEVEQKKIQEEQQLQREKQQLLQSQRAKSPPVPALHRKIKSNSSKQNSPRESINSSFARPDSGRPLSASASTVRPDSANQPSKTRGSSTSRNQKDDKETPRAHSADVLNQLKVLKKGLHQKLLENDMRDGYDASLGILGKDSAPINQKAVLLRRGSHHVGDSPGMANDDVLKDFNQLKYRGGSASHSAFRSRFPDPPNDISSLELQQREMIKHQEETLQKIRANGGYKYNYENGHPPLLRQKTVSPYPMLDSKSAFYDADHMAPLNYIFPEDDLNKNELARSRRRNRLHSPQLTPLHFDSVRSNSATSFASLNPEALAARNEERLKKLKNMTDAISLTEPEEILDKFMLKQQRILSTPGSIY